MITQALVEVLCDNYEELVEEKRKRVGEDDVVSKRLNTRNARQEEQAQQTSQKEAIETSMKSGGSDQPARMGVDDSARKGKEQAAPAYKLRLDIE